MLLVAGESVRDEAAADALDGVVGFTGDFAGDGLLPLSDAEVFARFDEALDAALGDGERARLRMEAAELPASEVASSAASSSSSSESDCLCCFAFPSPLEAPARLFFSAARFARIFIIAA